MAHGIAGAAANQGRRHRARQQARSHGLGDHDKRGALQGTRRTSGVKRIAPGTRRYGRIGISVGQDRRQRDTTPTVFSSQMA